MSPIFQKHCHRVADDLDMPADSMEDQVAVFNALASLNSWSRKDAFPRGSRWFSWHECAHRGLAEWHGSRLLFEHYFGEEVCDPDEPNAGGDSGLKNAYLCLSEENWENVVVMLECERPLWSWYTGQIQNIKTGQDSFRYYANMATTWDSDFQLMELASLLGRRSREVFEKASYWSRDLPALGRKIFKFVTSLMGHRASSLSKHSAPPFCWAELIFPNDCDIDTVLTLMSKDWKRLLALEQSVVAGAQELAEFLRLCLDPCSRIMVQAFETYSFQMAEGPFVILRQLFGNMPDAKLVEDTHQRVRVSQKKQPNKSLTMGQIQQVVNDSNVWESRGVEVLAKCQKNFSAVNGGGLLTSSRPEGFVLLVATSFRNISAKSWVTSLGKIGSVSVRQIWRKQLLAGTGFEFTLRRSSTDPECCFRSCELKLFVLVSYPTRPVLKDILISRFADWLIFWLDSFWPLSPAGWHDQHCGPARNGHQAVWRRGPSVLFGHFTAKVCNSGMAASCPHEFWICEDATGLLTMGEGECVEPLQHWVLAMCSLHSDVWWHRWCSPCGFRTLWINCQEQPQDSKRICFQRPRVFGWPLQGCWQCQEQIKTTSLSCLLWLIFFSEGDQEFIDTVTKKIKKEQEEENVNVTVTGEDLLIDQLLKGIEQSELKDFQSLKPKEGKQKAAEVAQWRQWYAEKVKEVKVSWFDNWVQSLLLNFNSGQEFLLIVS